MCPNYYILTKYNPFQLCLLCGFFWILIRLQVLNHQPRPLDAFGAGLRVIGEGETPLLAVVAYMVLPVPLAHASWRRASAVALGNPSMCAARWRIPPAPCLHAFLFMRSRLTRLSGVTPPGNASYDGSPQ